MSNVIEFKPFLDEKQTMEEATTAGDQYYELDVKVELERARDVLRRAGVGRSKTPFMCEIMPMYDIDIRAYKKLLNIFKQTGVLNGKYRLCGLRGVMEILIPNGRYVINLTANGKL